jgi:molybdate transport system substrate-binding protein
MTDCLDEFGTRFEETHPGVSFKTNYSGTQELKIQVEQGAVCDVFVSADESHMKDLVGEGHVTDPKVLAYNKLCVAADKQGGEVSSLKDLAKKGVRLVVATPDCPAGKYTRQCWKKLGESKEFGPALVAGLARNVVSQEINVKLVLSKVVLGEADACFVYASDVLGQDVRILELPEEVQVRATYLVGTGKRAPSPKTAEEYVRALTSERGADLLKEFGLAVPAKAE